MLRSTSEDSPDMLVRKTKYRVWGVELFTDMSF